MMEERVANRNKNLKDHVHDLVEWYSERKYKLIFDNWPGFLEALSICLICDSEETIENANDIIRGAKQWTWDNRRERYNLEPNSHGRLESGSTLDAAKTSVLNKLNISRPRDYKSLYKSIGGLFDKLKPDYNIAKQASSAQHTTNFTGKYDYSICTRADIGELLKFREILSKENIFSEETSAALSSIVIDDKDYQVEWHDESDNKDLYDARRAIEELTNHFDTSKKYIMIAPPYFEDKYRNKMDNGFLLNLFKIPWTMVVDFNDKSEDGLFKSLPNELKNIYYEIQKGREDYIPNGNSKCPWVFANGTGYNSCKDDVDKWIDERYYVFVKSVFDRMNQSVSDYVFVWFYDKGAEYAKELLQEFGRDFFAKKSNTFISICNGNDDFERDMKLRGFETNPLKTDVVQFILDISKYKNLSKINNTDSQHLYIRNSDGEQFDLSNEMEDLKDMGFELVTRDSKDDDNRQWNFYQGAEISWTELKDHKDVEREGLDELTKAVLGIIKQKSSNPNPREYIISYSAGSGSTTMSRRLGYDIFRKSEGHEFGEKKCVVMFLHDFNRRTTNNGLVKLSKRIDNQPILVICDYCDVPDEEYNDLKLFCSNRNIVFVRLEPKDKCKKYDFRMPMEISKEEEWTDFKRIYGAGFGDTKEIKKKIEIIRKSFENNGKIEVIEFPLCLEKNVSDNLVDYVKAKIDELPSENLKIFCEMIAFGYIFCRTSINSKLFRELLQDGGEREYQEQVLVDYLHYLLIKDENSKGSFWKPRYHQFASWILKVRSTIDWDSIANLKRLADVFINNCKNNIDPDYREGKNELAMLDSIFAINEDGNDCSPYINKVGKEEGERILQKLIDFWPDDPYFSIHYARLLFERAYDNKKSTPDDDDYVESGELIEKALSGNENNSKVWNVHGTRYFRMIGSLKNQYDSIKQRDDINSIDSIDYINRLKEYVNNAKESFIESERLDPDSSYGYAQEAAMYFYALHDAKIFKQSDNFDFVVDEYPWYEYLDRFGEVIDIMDSNGIISKELIKEHKDRYFEITGETNAVLKKYFAEALSENNNSEKRIRYGSMFHRLFLKKLFKDNGSYKDIKRSMYEKLLDLYKKNAETCQDINSYRRWFDLLRYGNESVTFDEAIEVLNDWRNLCKDKCKKLENKNEIGKAQRSLLVANFYLYVCMTCQIILDRKNSAEWRRKVEEIEMEVAKCSANITELSKKQLCHRCYLTEKKEFDDNELHYITDFSSEEDERNRGLKIEGDYFSKNNQGHIQLDCGLSVSFHRENDYYANGKRYKGVIVFKYAGTGMHEAKLVENDLSDSHLAIEETLDLEDVKVEEQSQIDKQPVPQTSSESKDGLKKETKLKGFTPVLYHGELKKRDGKFYILCEENNREYIVTYDLNNNDLYDGQKVVFQLIMDVTNPRFWKAIKIDVDEKN